MMLEYANGGDLLAYIQKLNGPIPYKENKLWMTQICDALEFLHRIDISHRDLKLENLLIDSARNVKLCDFGFARILGWSHIYIYRYNIFIKLKTK